MSVSVTKQEIQPRIALVIRRKTAAADIAKTLGECLGAVWAFAQRNAVPLAGPPFARYVEMGRGLMTIEAGLPIAVPHNGEGDIVATELPGGMAAVAIHTGAYDKLAETHAAIERYLDEHALTAGAPWETYVTDPATTPNAAEWKTEVVYPLAPMPRSQA